jgi:hypothetical protein
VIFAIRVGRWSEGGQKVVGRWSEGGHKVVILNFGICLVLGAWNLEFVWHLVPGIWNLFGAWCLEFGICLAFGAWNLEFVIWNPEPGTLFRLPPNYPCM